MNKNRKLASATRPNRTVIARIGAYSLHAKYDSKQITAAARAAFESRWENEVDPDRSLEPFERARRAKHAKKAYFSRLGMLSGKARRGAV